MLKREIQGECRLGCYKTQVRPCGWEVWVWRKQGEVLGDTGSEDGRWLDGCGLSLGWENCFSVQWGPVQRAPSRSLAASPKSQDGSEPFRAATKTHQGSSEPFSLRGIIGVAHNEDSTRQPSQVSSQVAQVCALAAGCDIAVMY